MSTAIIFGLFGFSSLYLYWNSSEEIPQILAIFIVMMSLIAMIAMTPWFLQLLLLGLILMTSHKILLSLQPIR